MITLARMAMATRFEIVLEGDSPGLRAAGEEALDEIERIEGVLSLYKPSSEVAHLNGRAATEAVKVSAEMFSLLERSVALSVETEGAFDVTIAPLVRCWGFMRGNGSPPTDAEVEAARAQVGFHFLDLDQEKQTVRFAKPGMMLDFGAFGKGYAVDCASEILREAGVPSALLHGGTSTVFGLGAPKEEAAWKVSIEGLPAAEATQSSAVAVAALRDSSLGVSAVWGKSFASQGRTFGHILDARTGRPSERADLAAVSVPSAAESDALSTALLVDGSAAIERFARLRPGARLLTLRAGHAIADGFAIL